MSIKSTLKSYWRSMTIRVGVIGLVVTNAFMLLPSWESLPTEIKDLVPPEKVPYVSMFILMAGMISKGMQSPTYKVSDLKQLRKQLDEDDTVSNKDGNG